MAKRRNIPRPYAGGTMTEAAFFGMMRSALRRVKWAPKYQALHAARRTLAVKKGNQKYEYQCAHCNDWHKGKEVQVDHIIPCGSLKKWEDLEGFAKRLYCEASDMRVLCKPCHQIVTNKERGVGCSS